MNEIKLREIPFGRPWIDETDRRAVMQVLEGHVLTHGPKCKEFENKFSAFMGGGSSVTTSSCMAALHLASIFCKLQQGDEVLVPAQTHVATVHAVELLGATPVFVDCEIRTGNMNLDLIESKITKKTKAIFVVHFVGIPADMEKLCAIGKKHGLMIVEDCALAVGAYVRGRHVGLWGDMGCYSFYPVKHMTTAEGGMFVSKNESLAKEVAHFRAFSVDRTHGERKIPGVYDVTGVGLNYRMSEVQAALGCTQVDKLASGLSIRKSNFEHLKSLLLKVKGIERILDSTSPDLVNSHYCLTAILDPQIRIHRNQILLRLTELGIGSSVYYPQPVPRMKYYREKYQTLSEEYPNASIISDGSLALPVGPHLGKMEMDAISEAVSSVLTSL